MTKPPERKITKPARTTIRLDPEKHAELQAVAEMNGRSMNAEIMARINRDPTSDVRQELAELKAMVRELLDLARGVH